MRTVKLIEVKSEIGAGTRGASLGIDAIKIAAMDFHSLYFKKLKSVEIQNENKELFEPIINHYAKHINAVYKIYQRVSKEVAKSVKRKQFPLILAGDHSTAGGTIAGIKIATPKKRLGVIWIDAHADIHSPYTTPSGNMHGMPLALSLGEDNMECRVNDPIEETVMFWNKLKKIGGICPKINYEDIVYVGLRDTEEQEEHLLEKHKVKRLSVAQLRKTGISRSADRILKMLKDCDHIYISFDVDSMDPKISRGTGTPVPKGLSSVEAANFASRLVQSPKVCCFEMVEVNTTLDRENTMAENAFKILRKVTNQLTRVE
ncbi:MAG: arginase [Bacteroidia bacterium]